MKRPVDVLPELQWRGLVNATTDLIGLSEHLTNAKRRVYAGFDPTADSLTIGNLVPVMLLAHFKKAGHEPVVVMGGGTGLIGDPSGKSSERQLMTPERVRKNINKQRGIFEAVLDRVEGPPFIIMDNASWLRRISYLNMLRNVGKHFSVNMMLQRESVKTRLENREQGISYTEFSYMILQAYDFLHLYEKHGVTVQIGGSDQFGNIVAGIDLIRREGACVREELQCLRQSLHSASFSRRTRAIQRARRAMSRHLSAGNWREWAGTPGVHTICLADQPDSQLVQSGGGDAIRAEVDLTTAWAERDSWESFGLTAPLVQKADGGKFGKTESGAVWLTAERTSPYAYHQFWLNASDADALNFLRTFTFLDKPTIDGLAESMRDNPAAREAQKRLADEATTILHGEDECRRAKAAGAALFSGDVSSLDERTLREVLADVPSSDHDRAALGQGVDPVALLTATGLAKSNREAREFLSGGSVAVNGRKIGPDDRLTGADLLHGSLMALRRGKKTWHLARWS